MSHYSVPNDLSVRPPCRICMFFRAGRYAAFVRRKTPLTVAIVLSFDRWHAGFMGCYGNPWVDTPQLDALAVRAAVFDQHFAENLAPSAQNHAWWTGRYQFAIEPHRQPQEPLWIPLLAGQAITTHLQYDPASRLPIPPGLFSTQDAVSLTDVPDLHPEDGTPKFITRAIKQIRQRSDAPQQAGLLWFHLGGLPVDTSSPLFAEDYAEEPIATDNVSESTEFLPESDQAAFPPRFWRRNRSSPRELADAQLTGTGWTSEHEQDVNWQLRREQYEAQVAQWDTWIGQLLEAVRERRQHEPVLLIVTAARGEHLGEHSKSTSVGLYEEEIRVPLLIELPLDDPFPGRRPQLTQCIDLAPTLLDWFGVSAQQLHLDGHSLLPVIRDDCPSPHETLFLSDGIIGGVRTADHYCRLADQPTGPEPEIYIKPDDRWDIDNSVRQYPDEAEILPRRWQELLVTLQQRSAAD